MSRSEDMKAAWKGIYGTEYDNNNIACIHFSAGYFAAGYLQNGRAD